jgi:hypothetical protein
MSPPEVPTTLLPSMAIEPLLFALESACIVTVPPFVRICPDEMLMFSRACIVSDDAFPNWIRADGTEMFVRASMVSDLTDELE